MYFRLERLFPHHSQIILAAGDFGAPDQSEAYSKLISLIDSEIGKNLKELTVERQVIAAYQAGRFKGGLVTVAARKFLSSSGE